MATSVTADDVDDPQPRRVAAAGHDDSGRGVAEQRVRDDLLHVGSLAGGAARLQVQARQLQAQQHGRPAPGATKSPTLPSAGSAA